MKETLKYEEEEKKLNINPSDPDKELDQAIRKVQRIYREKMTQKHNKIEKNEDALKNEKKGEKAKLNEKEYNDNILIKKELFTDNKLEAAVKVVQNHYRKRLNKRKILKKYKNNKVPNGKILDTDTTKQNNENDNQLQFNNLSKSELQKANKIKDIPTLEAAASKIQKAFRNKVSKNKQIVRVYNSKIYQVLSTINLKIADNELEALILIKIGKEHEQLDPNKPIKYYKIKVNDLKKKKEFNFLNIRREFIPNPKIIDQGDLMKMIEIKAKEQQILLKEPYKSMQNKHVTGSKIGVEAGGINIVINLGNGNDVENMKYIEGMIRQLKDTKLDQPRDTNIDKSLKDTNLDQSKDNKIDQSLKDSKLNQPRDSRIDQSLTDILNGTTCQISLTTLILALF